MDLEEEYFTVEKAKVDIRYFKVLYDKYYSKIFAYIFYLTGNKEITEDIVSATFEKAILNINKYEYRGYTFGSWLFRISRNLIYDYSTKTSNVPLSNIADISISTQQVEQLTEEALNNEELFKAIDQLDLHEREVIVLRYIQEFSIKEVANIIGKSVNSVKSTNKRALKHLQLLLKDKINDTF